MDKASLRRLQLIDILSSQEKCFKTEELAKKLNCTEKTIRTDIQYLNSTFPDGWHIDTIKGKGIYINNPINSSLDQIRSLFFKNSLSLQVIMFILVKEIEYISDLGKVLYTHHNTVYKILERVDLFLKSYDLSLKRAPLEIVGSEFQKRILCCDVLYGLFSHTNKWPYDSISFSLIKKIVMDTSEKNNIFLYPSTLYKYIYYVGTMLQRIDRDLHLELNHDNNIKDSIFFSIASEICMQLEANYKILIPSNEIQALSLILSTFPYFCDEEESRDEVIKLYHSKSEKLYVELHEFVTMLEKKLLINLHDNVDFIFTLQKQFKAVSFVLFVKSRITSFSLIVHYVLKHYPDLFKKVKDVFSEWSILFSYPEVSNEIAAKITLTIQAQLINLTNVKKRVLLLTSQGHGVHHYIASKLNKEFGNKIQFIEPNKSELTSENVKELFLDIIVADFQIDIDTVPVAVISSTLSQRDINHIAQLLK